MTLLAALCQHCPRGGIKIKHFRYYVFRFVVVIMFTTLLIATISVPLKITPNCGGS